MKDKNVDYIDILLPVDGDNDHFYYLVSVVMVEDIDQYYYAAILCNDETDEIVELSCNIVYGW